MNSLSQQYDILTEQAVLGSIIELGEPAYIEARELVSYKDFYFNKHRIIFWILSKLFDNQVPIDLVTVSRALRKAKKLEDVGGDYYLTELVSASPVFMVAGCKEYANNVKHDSLKRQAQKIAHELNKAVAEIGSDIQDVLNKAVTDIVQLNDDKSVRTVLTISEAVDHSRDDMQKMISGSQRGSVVPPYPEVKRLGHWESGDLIVLAGDTGSGKSTLAMEISRLLAHTGVHTVFASLEMERDEITKKLTSAEGKQFTNTDLPFSKMAYSKSFVRDNWDDIVRTGDDLKSLPMWISDNFNASIESIQSLFIKMRTAYPKKDFLFVVDYIQLVNVENKKFQSRQQQVAYISRQLKLLSQRINAPILALSQLNKDTTFREEHKAGGRPTKGAIREAGDVENDASKIFVIWGNTSTDTRILITLKNRHGISGKIADIVLNWNPKYSRYWTDEQVSNLTQQPIAYTKRGKPILPPTTQNTSSQQVTFDVPDDDGSASGVPF